MKRTQKWREPARCDQSNSKTCSEPVQARLPVPFFALHSGSTTDAGSRRLPANSAQHKIPCSTAKTPAYVLFLAYSISVQKRPFQNSVKTKYFYTPLCPRCFRVGPPARSTGLVNGLRSEIFLQEMPEQILVLAHKGRLEQKLPPPFGAYFKP